MVRQTVQNGHITKNGVLPATTLLFRKFCFSLRTLDKEWIWCTNHQNDNWWFIIFENLFLCESTFSLSLLLQMTIVFRLDSLILTFNSRTKYEGNGRLGSSELNFPSSSYFVWEANGWALVVSILGKFISQGS